MDDGGGGGYKGEWTPSKHLNKDYFQTPGEKYRILPQRSEEEFDLESLQRFGACAPVCKYPDGIWPSSKQRGEKSDQILGKSGFEIQPQLLFSSHTLLSSNSKQWPSLELLKNSTSTITKSAFDIPPSSKLKIVSLSSFVDSVGLLGHSLQKVGLPSGVKEVVNTGDSRTKPSSSVSSLAQVAHSPFESMQSEVLFPHSKPLTPSGQRFLFVYPSVSGFI